MRPNYDLLPRNKFDDAAVARLALLPEAELLPLLPDLAMWVQDWNWPIAPDVEKILEQHVAALVPTILEVLGGTDGIWKNNLLYLIRPETLSTLPMTLRAAAERIATAPTVGEQADGTAEAARDLLDLYATHLLPQHKGDDQALERLRQLPEADLLPLLPELLDCLLDMNWPIARPAWEILLPRVGQLEAAILEVLAGTDDTWKANVMRLLSQSALPALPAAIRQLVERIAYAPTRQEQTEEADEAARDLLAHYA